MTWHRTRAARWLLPLSGIALLALALLLVRYMARIGAGHAGQEPPVLYLLALISFVLASSGTALTLWGARLFDTVPVGDRWIAHDPRRNRSDDPPSP